MKNVTFEIKNHFERMQILDALIDNGYQARIQMATEYMPPKVLLVVEVEDREVSE